VGLNQRKPTRNYTCMNLLTGGLLACPAVALAKADSSPARGAKFTSAIPRLGLFHFYLFTAGHTSISDGPNDTLAVAAYTGPSRHPRTGFAAANPTCRGSELSQAY
jgi:hypothetical protein